MAADLYGFWVQVSIHIGGYVVKWLVTICLVSQLGRADNPSIFKISEYGQKWMGTAFSLQTKRGPVTITNAHVCGKEKQMIAILPNRSFTLLLVKRIYKKQDLCMLTPAYGVPTLRLANEYAAGSKVTVEGFPLDIHKITTGFIGAFVMQDPDEDSTIPGVFSVYYGLVNFGSSGSPVIDSNGDVVGVISRVDGIAGRYGLFIPLVYLKDFVDNYR